LLPGRADHALDHLLLQHEGAGRPHARRQRQQVEQDRRGDVVGQVAHHAQRLAERRSASAREVDLQHVGLDHVDAAVAPPARGQVAVELDHGQHARRVAAAAR
jgi:hypothetical protein